MSKKLFGKAAGVLALVIGMAFISCDDKVTVNLSKAPAVKAVTVTKTTNNQYYIVSWDSAGADLNYGIYFRQDGKKSSTNTYSGGDPNNVWTYDPYSGEALPNTDWDKWSCRITAVNTDTAGNFSFGVRTGFTNDAVTNTYSAITWSTPFAITAGPKVASVTASKTTDGNYIIVKWNAVASIDNADANYAVFVEKDYDMVYNDMGQNGSIYGVADGAPTTNAEASAWSYRYYVGGTDAEGIYRFSVLAGDSTADYDIGVLRGVKVFTTNTVTVTD